MTDLDITPARRRGLAAVALKGWARESNCTDIAKGLIYWQTARTLAAADLIAREGGDKLANSWVLTAAGRQLATELGLHPETAG